MTKVINDGFRPFFHYSVSDLEKFVKEFPSVKIKEQIIFELTHRNTKRSRILFHKLTETNLKEHINEKNNNEIELLICKEWEEGKTKLYLAKKYKCKYPVITKIINTGIKNKDISSHKRKQIKLDKLKALEEEKHRKKIIKASTLTQKEEKILNFRKSGLTLEEIGEKYNVSRERIRQILVKIEKKGFKSPKNSHEIKRIQKNKKNKQLIFSILKKDKEKFIKEYKKNLSDKETAKNLNLNLSIFKSILEKLIENGELNRRLKIFNEKNYIKMKKEWDEIYAMRKANYSNEKIASILGTSSQMISIKIERMRSNGYLIQNYGSMHKRDYSVMTDKNMIAYRSKTIVELNNKLLTKSQIAKKLGMDYRSLCRHIDLYLIDY